MTILNMDSIRGPMFETQKSGDHHTFAWRKTQLTQLQTLVSKHQSDFVDALYADLHKESTEAMYSEILLVLSEIQRFLVDLPTWMKPETVSSLAAMAPSYCEVRRMPLSPPGCLIIGPFNYPMSLALLPVIGALAGGNPVVLKPSELSKNVSALFAKLVPQYFDKGVFQGMLEVYS